MNEFVERQVSLRFAAAPKRSYDVVIVGAGGHGLSTAYHLASRHGITNVAVLDRSYIGGGNSGRNTTVIRSNYGIPEAVAFYQRSTDLYARLSEELGRDLLYVRRGSLWLAHSEPALRGERARAHLNTACGAVTEFVEPAAIAELCPQLDLTGGGRYPILGATYHPGGATARHDRVVWGYAEAAMRAGIDVCQGVEVERLLVDGGRCTGVQTSAGAIAAGVVLSAVGGRATTIARTAGVRLPIVTHPLQAFVTNHYAQTFAPIIASADLLLYMSQTPRGEMLVGAEIDRQPSYSTGSTYDFLQVCALRAMTLAPFMRNLRILRQWTGVCDMSPDYSPIMGETGVDGFLISTGWGTWGFKAVPAGGEQMAETIATGRPTDLIEPFRLSRFADDRTMADRGSAGTH